MFARKKAEPGKKRQHDLSQFGLMEIPDDFDPSDGYAGGGDDSDLEAELAAIAGGGSKPQPKAKPKPQLVNMNEIDKMIAESLKDISDDDDGDLDENADPDLLGELKNIASDGEENELLAEENQTVNDGPAEPQQTFLPTTTVDTVSIIRQRIEMYKIAETNAKETGEAGKARRFNRGLKTLNDLLKQANAGKTINVDDIPPEVFVKPLVKPEDGGSAASDVSSPTIPKRAAPPPPQPKPSPPETDKDASEASVAAPNPLIGQMRARQQEYKVAALQSKRAGDTETALQFLKVVKQFDVVIKMCEDGQEVDLSDMPPPPAEFKEFLSKMQEGSGVTEPTTIPSQPTESNNEPANPPAAQESPSAPTTILEALEQRLNKYKSVEESAKAEGNSSKARRFGRIVKQYEDAIKSHKAGRPVAFDELPIPPGFGPLPTGDAPPAASQPPPTSNPTSPISPTSPKTATTSVSTPNSSQNTTPIGTPVPVPKRPSPPKPELTTRTSGNHQKNNLAEQQMKILLERQKEFKIAALEAKKAGEIDQAKEYIKIYKGFDSLLNAASSGLPVDLNTLPLPPSQRENLEASFAIVTSEDCDPDGDISEIGIRIEEQLAKQLMMCKNTRDHHKAMGDVAGMNRFENLAVTVQKDLDLVRYSKRQNLPLPKFHYEKRSFNIVHCNTELSDSDLEIVVVRGLNYNVQNPKSVDTYVRVEFPLLNEETFKAKTNLIRDTESPDYDQRFNVEIQRNNRQFQRIFKRHGVKFEVYSRGGFLRSDVLIGTVNVKLQPLETKCDIHDTFDLMEGRKPVGGKLEIKLRVRNPIFTKQMEHINEKWLVLDS